MKTYGIFTKSILLFSLVSFAACSSDDDVVELKQDTNSNNSTSGKLAFSASLQNDEVTRASIAAGNDIHWDSTDKIGVFCDNGTTGAQLSITPNSTPTTATFTTDDLPTGFGTPTTYYYSIHPYDATTTSYSSSTITSSLPAQQKVTTNKTYDEDALLMVACADKDEKDLAFKNIPALVKVTLSGNSDGKVKYIKIVAHNKDNKLSGSFTAQVGLTSITSFSATSDAANKNSVELEIPASSETKSYYIALLPGTLDKGYSVYFESAYNSTNGQSIAQLVKTSSSEFQRSKVYDLGEFAVSDLNFRDNVVDLGLPSGTLWATKNISEGSREGSNKTTSFVTNTTDVGGYFAWAEIATKSGIYVWGNSRNSFNYKYGKGARLAGNNSFNTTVGQGYLSRYNSSTNYQSRWFDSGNTPPDYVEQLAAEDDVAYLTDNRFCIPMYGQVEELLKNTTITHNNSVFVLTSKTTGYTDRTVSLPAGGYKGDYTALGSIIHDSEHACYWTKERSNQASTSYLANCIDIYESGLVSTTIKYTLGGEFRSEGRLIRPVVLNKAIAPLKKYTTLCTEAQNQ